MFKLKYKFFTLLLIVSTSVNAQQNVSSPYSRYALGDLNTTSFASYAGWGSVNLSLADSSLLNIQNPASYSFIMPHRPIFDIGVGGQYLQTSSAADSETSTTLGLRNIAIGIPITKRWGLSFGLTPFSSTGYNMSTVVDEPGIGNVTYSFTGSGGINRLYLGTGAKVFSNKKHIFSVGANASYLFGNLKRERKAVFPTLSGMEHSKIVHSTFVSDFTADAGILYRGMIDSTTWFSMGATIGVPSELNARQEMLAYTFRNLVSESLVDTIQYKDTTKGKLFLPLKFGYGMSVEINKPRADGGTRRFVVAGQFEMQDWSKFSEIFGDDTTSDNLRDSRSFGLGFQYTPQFSDKYNEPKLWRATSYRIGVRYANSYMQLNNTQLKQYGISFGLGIPLFNSASFSTMNLGFEYGKRGTTENNLLLENYFNFYLSFSIIPHRNDGWFYKRKYD